MYRVALVEQGATFRRGLEPALAAAGLAVESPGDPVGWVAGDPPGVVVVASAPPDSCKLTESIVAAGGTVVMLLSETTRAGFHHALAHGAMSAVDYNADPESIAAVVGAAAQGQSLLPGPIVRHLAQRGPAHPPAFSEEEASWLTALAAGRSVVELADDAGYSERSMFRRLHELYARLGVSNRDAAVATAQRLGLLEVPETG